MVNANNRFVIITGLSGAGKSEAVRALEDAGFFCVDNLPPALIPRFADMCMQAGSKITNVALVIDIRGGAFFNSTVESLETLEEQGVPYEILFLEAEDDILVRRFKETRRRHPLAPEGRVLEGITDERRRLEEIRGRAHRIIDTSDLDPRELQQQVVAMFSGDGRLPSLVINVVAFGFKHGLPMDADLVIDVRFLPNPHYVANLRPLTGNDEAVKEYVMRWPVTRKFFGHLKDMLDFLIPQYISEGKAQLTVAIGCTGGQHRSVVLANMLAEWLKQGPYTVSVEHRDVGDAGADEAAEDEAAAEAAAYEAREDVAAGEDVAAEAEIAGPDDTDDGEP